MDIDSKYAGALPVEKDDAIVEKYGVPIYYPWTKVPNYLKDVEAVFKFMVQAVIGKYDDNNPNLPLPTEYFNQFIWRFMFLISEFKSKDRQRWLQGLEIIMNMYTRRELMHSLWNIAEKFDILDDYVKFLHDSKNVHWNVFQEICLPL